MIKSRNMKWAEHVACMAKISSYKMLVGKSEGSRSVVKCSRRWEDIIKTDLREIGL
jgi:hypothetical protein